jgi:hypothetical protein
MKNNIIYVCLIVIAAVALGAYYYPTSDIKVGAASPSGTQQSIPKYAYETISTATVSTTTGSFAILNTGYDDVIESGFAFCTGVAAETQNTVWALTAATSSVATTSSTVYALNLTLATTSATLYVSSTTYATSGTGINGAPYLWPANTYLVFSFNATDTASCTAGVRTFQL